MLREQRKMPLALHENMTMNVNFIFNIPHIFFGDK